MPRPRRTNRGKGSVMNQTVGANSTIMVTDSKDIEDKLMKLEMWKAEVKEKMNEARTKLEQMKKEKLDFFELEYRNSLMSLPESVLNEVIDIDSDAFRCFILNEKPDVSQKRVKNSLTPQRATARRRSRSATNVKTSTRRSSRLQHLRSTSVDVYKTPKGRVRLSSIMSHKKYTVSKPRKVENTGVHVRRIMKPDEEAISTCGSPLYVVPSTLGGPHVNIPLPGGVVLNIEPKQPIGPLEIPNLDPKTKNQIKLLCEQLEKLNSL